MIEEECDELKTATNGEKFQIKMVTEKDKNLPVPVWENDTRNNKKLKFRHGITIVLVILF